MLRTCIAIRHILFEDLGVFEPAIRRAGYDIRYLDAPIDSLGDATDADLLVILGGPCGVYEDQLYPYIAEEVSIAKHRIDHALPTLGVCLGAQIIARAAGTKVYPGENGKEIGWGAIALSEEGLQSVIAPLGESGAPMFHWHGDTFDLPKGATLLASSELYDNQIFSIGDAILGFQSHPELDPEKIEHWLIGHACELSQSGIDIEQIRQDNVRYGKLMKANCTQAITNYLVDIESLH